MTVSRPVAWPAWSLSKSHQSVSQTQQLVVVGIVVVWKLKLVNFISRLLYVGLSAQCSNLRYASFDRCGIRAVVNGDWIKCVYYQLMARFNCKWCIECERYTIHNTVYPIGSFCFGIPRTTVECEYGLSIPLPNRITSTEDDVNRCKNCFQLCPHTSKCFYLVRCRRRRLSIQFSFVVHWVRPRAE